MPTLRRTYIQRLKDAKLRPDPQNAPGEPFYKTTRWRKVRDMAMRIHPLCADPFGHHREDGQTVLAQEVHHIKSRKQYPELAYAIENLQPLCKTCHSRISGRESSQR